MMPESATDARHQMLRDGYCVVPDVLTDTFVTELRDETARLNATLEHHPDTRYQGTHLGIKYADNPIMRRLAEWQPARDALSAMGFSDFQAVDGLLVADQASPRPGALLASGLDALERSAQLHPWPLTIFLSYYLRGATVENGCLKLIPGVPSETSPAPWPVGGRPRAGRAFHRRGPSRHVQR